jgi:glycosyltransferase involved in cell wall biosynthesis
MTDILVIGARGIPDAEGGAEKNAEAVLPILAAEGYDIELLGMREFIKSRSYKGVKLTAIPTLTFGKTDKLVYHVLAFLYAAVTRPRLVHLQGLNAGLLLALYKLFGLKVVLRYGSADHEYAKWGIVGRLGFKLCERQIRFADKVIAVSQKYKKVLEERYGLTRIQVVPNGVDAPMVSAEASDHWSTLGLVEKRYVLAVGRITVDKCYESLIEAFNGLDDPSLQLVIVGGVSEQAYWQRLKTIGNDRVRLLGRLDRRLLSALYSRCGVYVSSSLQEGLSNAVLEAVSYRCPIIVSDIPANIEMGFTPDSYFRAGDPEALRRVLERALTEPSKFIPESSQFLDWPAVAEKTENTYRALIPDFANRPYVRHPAREGLALPRSEPSVSVNRPA